MRILVAAAFVAAIFGGVVGAAFYAVITSGEQEPERGTVLRLPGNMDSYLEIDTTPFCVALQHFCLVRLDSGEVRALYTYDTHPLFRAQSCEIPWRPDFSFTNPATGEESVGWFRANCSGSTFRYSGERVFGPTARDMDRFPVTSKTEDGIEYLEVDTRRLICGTLHTADHPPGCDRAPLPQ